MPKMFRSVILGECVSSKADQNIFLQLSFKGSLKGKVGTNFYWSSRE